MCGILFLSPLPSHVCFHAQLTSVSCLMNLHHPCFSLARAPPCTSHLPVFYSIGNAPQRAQPDFCGAMHFLHTCAQFMYTPLMHSHAHEYPSTFSMSASISHACTSQAYKLTGAHSLPITFSSPSLTCCAPNSVSALHGQPAHAVVCGLTPFLLSHSSMTPCGECRACWSPGTATP